MQKCAGCDAAQAAFACPQCQEHVSDANRYFCTQVCFRNNWKSHKKHHVAPKEEETPESIVFPDASAFLQDIGDEDDDEVTDMRHDLTESYAALCDIFRRDKHAHVIADVLHELQVFGPLIVDMVAGFNADPTSGDERVMDRMRIYSAMVTQGIHVATFPVLTDILLNDRPRFLSIMVPACEDEPFDPYEDLSADMSDDEEDFFTLTGKRNAHFFTESKFRLEHTAKHGWARAEMLGRRGTSWILRHANKFIEVGAGHGHLAKVLSEAGGHVLACDTKQPGGAGTYDTQAKEVFTPIKKSTAAQFVTNHRKEARAGYALLVACPQPMSLATEALEHYKGDTVVYWGEAPSMINADTSFHDMLEEKWTMVDAARAPRKFGSQERIVIYKKKE